LETVELGRMNAVFHQEVSEDCVGTVRTLALVPLEARWSSR